VYDKYTAEERHLVAEEEYRVTLSDFTKRKMTNDSDSLNAYLGILNSITRDWLPSGFVCGLPLKDFPQSLRWFHSRQVKPRRRPAFPSWSWAGWEGQVSYSEPLDLRKDETSRYIEAESNMMITFMGFEHPILTIKAAIVKLDVRTEPFSDVYVEGSDEYIGMMRERNFLHNNTIMSGVYSFLVVERVRYKSGKDQPWREDVYMLLLDWDGDVAVRRTKVRLFIPPECRFEQARPNWKIIQLK
jgi:hypothetical protein